MTKSKSAKRKEKKLEKRGSIADAVDVQAMKT